jgi:hypothetical protein
MLNVANGLSLALKSFKIKKNWQNSQKVEKPHPIKKSLLTQIGFSRF